ncbi:MAG: carboxypeptidase-like regulatory domain-containing protein [Cyanobacteria bacterium SIG32]|nr:carboxypeptidase-like regulatory domain-containing protein [Cyanobacteria bacterium SIG32]
MKQILLLIALIISQSAYGALDVVGNKIIDSATNSPISNAKITIPKYNYSTYTDTNGNFNFDKNIDSSTIMSVEKEGYRPFSLTINQRNNVSKPLVLGIEKSNISDIVIESSMMHLGDDNYSQSSANADNFRLNTIGPSFSKNFIMKRGTLSSQNYLVIGSILGIDTLLARSMGQNSIVNSYASPPEVYFNGVKIAEIQLNGDNQKIKLPNNLIKAEQANQITIKAGKNLMQRAYLDYDDIEIANLSIMSE